MTSNSRAKKRNGLKMRDVRDKKQTVNNYSQVTGTDTGENFAFFIYKHCPEITLASALGIMYS